eukprot:6244504-Prorocentrum_lima.AAC.1
MEGLSPRGMAVWMARSTFHTMEELEPTRRCQVWSRTCTSADGSTLVNCDDTQMEDQQGPRG